MDTDDLAPWVQRVAVAMANSWYVGLEVQRCAMCITMSYHWACADWSSISGALPPLLMRNLCHVVLCVW